MSRFENKIKYEARANTIVKAIKWHRQNSGYTAIASLCDIQNEHDLSEVTQLVCEFWDKYEYPIWYDGYVDDYAKYLHNKTVYPDVDGIGFYYDNIENVGVEAYDILYLDYCSSTLSLEMRSSLSKLLKGLKKTKSLFGNQRVEPILVINVATKGRNIKDAISLPELMLEYTDLYELDIEIMGKESYSYKSGSFEYTTYIFKPKGNNMATTITKKKATSKKVAAAVQNSTFDRSTQKVLAYHLLSNGVDAAQIEKVTGLSAGSVRAYKAHVTMGNVPSYTITGTVN